VDDELVPAQVAERLDLDGMGTEGGETVLVRLSRGLGVFERRHSTG
jgi:hypothetical protein